MKKLQTLEDYPISAGHCLIVGKRNCIEPHCVVTVRDDVSDLEAINVLVHESVHVWQEMCREIGEENPGAETEAYHIQCIFSQLYDHYLESKKKNGKN